MSVEDKRIIQETSSLTPFGRGDGKNLSFRLRPLVGGEISLIVHGVRDSLQRLEAGVSPPTSSEVRY